MEAHSHQPRLTAAAVEQGRGSILEFFSVPYCLFHGLRHIQPLHSLDLDMYPGEAGQVRHFPERQGAAPLKRVAIFTEQGSKLSLPVCSLALL